MANFAIAADENVIARGNKLIEELQEPGEKKGVTLNRLFDQLAPFAPISPIMVRIKSLG